MEIKGIGEELIQSFLKEKATKEPDSSFSDLVEEFVNWVNQQQQRSKEIKEAVLSGEDIPLHRMVIEFEKAGVALNLLIEIRNRLLEGFQELMRMQV